MTWRLGYRPALDGLRGIAVLLVIAVHYGVPFLQGGSSAGVLTFFVLSGFLITALLLQERASTGRIDRWAFIGRRIRRLIPALAMMLTYVAVVAALSGLLDELWPSIALAVFYAGDIIMPGYPLQHTWTLAVEEQFYLVWPFLLVIGVRWPFVFVAGLALLTPFGGTLSGFGAVAVGCLIGWVAHTNRLPRLGAPLAWLGLAGLVGLSTIDSRHTAHPLVLVGIVASAALVVAVTASRSWRSPLTWSPLRYIGRISYGLYLWHGPILWLVGVPMIALVTSFAVAAASWRYVEGPILAKAPRHKNHQARNGALELRGRVGRISAPNAAGLRQRGH